MTPLPKAGSAEPCARPGVASLMGGDLDYVVMDCVETNLAAQLRLAGLVDVHRVLGSQWHFAFAEERGVAGLELERLEPAEQLRQLGGVEAMDVQLEGALIRSLRELVERHGPVLVYGDAHDLPWLPLQGKAHLEHTFLVLDVSPAGEAVSIVDTYTNRTPYGDCNPVAIDVAAAVVGDAIRGLATARSRQALVLSKEIGPPSLSPKSVIDANVAVLLAELRERDAIRRFASHYEGVEDQAALGDFSLACWLVARKRALHHRWLAEVEEREERLVPAGFIDAFEAQIVEGWRRAAAFAYVGSRRARAGKVRPGPVYDLVRSLHLTELEMALELEFAQVAE